MRYLICLLLILCVSCSSTPEPTPARAELDKAPPVSAEEAEGLDSAWEEHAAESESTVEPTQLAYELILTWPIDSGIFGQIIKEIYQIQIQGSGDVVVRVDSEHIRRGDIFLHLDVRHATDEDIELIPGVRTSRTSLECRFETPGSSGTIYAIVTSHNEEKLDYELTVTEIEE